MDPLDCFERHGHVQIAGIVSAAQCQQLAASLGVAEGAGSRAMLSHPAVAQLARSLPRHPALAGLIPPGFVATQCTFFEKSAARNWLVPLHQDLSIAVASRVAHADLGAWSSKEGAWFVQPPAAVLRQLVAVRVHLDDCAAADGALRVVPGSHHHGVLTTEQAWALRDAAAEQLCTVAQGGVMLLRPLLLHASSRGTGDSRRRVLHFVYGPAALPYGLRWHTAI